ncbi:DUF3393 domain-containing protein [Pseudoalteromonas sp. C2R02]|uniref:murein transglycosylase domain-containing protein n=1 Tax=Pseudoalteromonas sp. C2R02 TaxID=2841565 RepID=UPI001C0A60B3|nr:murein transglycosylase domain-containing protein [Pseudoalteromonas sp. C2R02]MBU2970590.1 DUF3393 domain-containing protein [Pseudoalteromonas sp. C2R02]
MLTNLAINFAYATPPDLTFDEIDKLLDKQFKDKTDQIDAIYDAYSKAIEESFKGASKKISVKWPDDIRLPSKNTWVGYSKNLETRSVINYEKGEVIIETKVESEALKVAKVKLDKMAKTLTSKNNSDINELDVFAKELNQNLRNKGIDVKHSKVEKFNPLNAVLPKKDVIINIAVEKLSVSNQEKSKEINQEASQPIKINTPSTQEKIINSTLSKDTGVKLELIAKGDESILRMSIKFVNDYQKVLMEQNFDSVKQFSSQYGVPISIILAIVETESSFNPRAVSAVPAFGLMQLVPKTAGIDAHNYAHGQKKVVSPEYLFDETNNLQLGTAYFKLLQSRYLRKIKDPLSRFYCAVASYNTGVGNLAKTFTGEKNLSKAAKTINQMSAEQVYSHLLTYLPAQETRNYLKKIVARKSKYAHFDS